MSEAAYRHLQSSGSQTPAAAGLHLAQVARADSPGELVGVGRSDVNLAVYERALEPELQSSAALFGDRLRDALALDLSQFDPESENLPGALQAACAAAIKVSPESRAGQELLAFANDAAGLLRSFARIARDSETSGNGRAPALRLRVDRVEDDMCSAFHTDCYRMRLICSYRGPGTEWTPNDNVNRREFYSLPAAERLLDRQRIFRLGTGWVAILKGERFPGAEGRAVVHRSPPATPGEWRLVLRIDCD